MTSSAQAHAVIYLAVKHGVPASLSLLVTPYEVPETMHHKTDAVTLVERIAQLGRCVVAFSGGVDSAVVAAATWRADQLRFGVARDGNDKRSIAVTADSPSVAREQLATAQRVAREIGIHHEIICTDELSRSDYRANDRRRCFYCKSTLYSALAQTAQRIGIATILSGTNADDLGDYRPGIEAGNQAGVIAPLAQFGLTKERVRAIARGWNLSIAERPAQPCLSSRLAYGVEVTRDRLHQIEQAEAFIAQRGYTPLRVRLLANGEARIEVALDAQDRLLMPAELQQVTEHLVDLGFRSVTVDPRGFRSGSLNELFQLETKQQSQN